jgi:hypothetical protein
MSEQEPWYWDLNKNRAVRASERGLAADTLGPYPTKFEAEHWHDRVEERNEAWEEADEEWDDAGRDADDSGS